MPSPLKKVIIEYDKIENKMMGIFATIKFLVTFPIMLWHLKHWDKYKNKNKYKPNKK